MKTRKRLFKSAILLALLCLSSCAQTDTDGTADTSLPAGKYPMTFTTAVNELSATRATTDNTWDGGESVTLQVGDETKLYTITGSSPSSTLTSTDPFYWTSSNETKSVCGWYYGDGLSRTLKESYKLQENQSGKDGYQMSDFLYAPTQEINFADNPKSLNFYHQTARVVINIVNAEAATDAGQIRSVVLGKDINLALSGAYTAPTGEANVGTWNIEQAVMGTITPKDITSSGSKYLKTYTALVIPQNMQGKKFIGITLTDGETYYYTPKTAEDANFESGMEYTYDVTVKYGKLEAVKVSESETWSSNGASIEVKSILAGFTAADLKIGDYYYSDGTTSDGGYRKYADGTSEVLNIRPVETSERHVIGIVFSTDVSRIGEAATTFLKEKKAVEPRGLVMALTNASEGCTWGRNNIDENSNGNVGEPFKENTDQVKKHYVNIDGYGETHWIIDTYGYNNEYLRDNYRAFYYAINYGTGETVQYTAPEKTTGWFVPSMGHWWDILSNLGGIDFSAFLGSTSGFCAVPGAASTAVDNINEYLNRIDSARQFQIYTYFWSSSENDRGRACRVDIGSSGNLYLGRSGKLDSSNKVRCILVF